METSEVVKPTPQEQTRPVQGPILPADELKRLTDFFSLLIQIDRRSKRNEKVCKTV